MNDIFSIKNELRAQQMWTTVDCMKYVLLLDKHNLIYHFDDNAEECFDDQELAQILNIKTEIARIILGDKFEIMFMLTQTLIDPEALVMN